MAKRGRPRKQVDLPGMEDRWIPEIHSAAMHYAANRDERMEALKTEVQLKERLRGFMQKHGKKEYTCQGVTVKLIVEAETVKVKILKQPEPQQSDVEVHVDTDSIEAVI